MNGSSASIRRCALACWLGVGACPVAVAAPPAAPAVLLLHNGRLVEGRIERVDDRYRIRQDGTEIQLKVGDVAWAAADRHECYQRQAGALDPAQAEGHLQLALWCLRYELLDEAQRELAAAESIEPLHPKIALVQRRLKLAAAATEAPSRSAPAAPRLLAAEDDAPPPAAGPSTRPAAPARLRADELDRFVRTLPEGVVGQFTSRVQPVLVNHCALAGCHGPGSRSSYVLDRVGDRRTANRRSTQRNLYATLQQIDAERPADSKLLTAPLRAHGTAPGPIFSGRQSAQYEQLVWWAQRASGKLPAASGKRSHALADGRPPVHPAEHREPAARPRRTQPPTEHTSSPLPAEPTPPSNPDDETGFTEPPFAGQPHGNERILDQGPLSPRDPFDPEIFNRRVLGK